MVNEVKILIKECLSISEIVRKLNLTENGYNIKKIRGIISEYYLDTSHFKKVKKSKYYDVEKKCPKCDTIFVTKNGGKKSKKFCSRSCSNSREWRDEDKKIKSESAKFSEKVKVANKKNGLKNPKKERMCSLCNGKFYYGKWKSRKYCSAECSTKAWSNHHKKLYADGKNFVAGGTTKWLGYKDIKVQGTYELRTCFILDEKKELGLIYDWMYTKDRYPYISSEGEERTYLLDFKVYETENKFHYLETKGWEKENDMYKWNAIKDLGHKHIVWRLNDIKEEENSLGIKN